MKYRVFLGNVTTGYLDKTAIRTVLDEGLLYTGIAITLEKPQKITIKPDVVACGRNLFSKHAHIHPAIFNNAMEALEKSATRSKLQVYFEDTPFGRIRKKDLLEMGYSSLLSPQSKITWQSEGNVDKVRYLLSKDEKALNAKLRAPLGYSTSTFRVLMPKLRIDSTSSGFSGAIRTLCENPDKISKESEISDYLQIFSPDLIITDAILVPQGGSRYTQNAQELGAILVANNPVAHDLIACELMQLDPMKIPHLKNALENGWGPSGLHDIEIGGIGYRGLKALSSKTKSWWVKSFPLRDFKRKVEIDNTGHRFPLEILSQNNDDPFNGVLYDTLCSMLDKPEKRNQFHRWPSTTICVGSFRSYPTKDYVFLFGHLACKSLELYASSKWTFFHWKDYTFSRVLLKNGDKKWTFEVNSRPGKAADTFTIGLVLFFGSFGRIRIPFVRPSIFFRKLITSWTAKKARNEELIMVTEMQQNEWWSLKRFQLRRKAKSI